MFLLAGGAFNCPEKYGQFEDPKQCDKYYECDEGVAKEKLCPDGLMFDPLNRKINKCDQPFNVDCGDRIELRESTARSYVNTPPCCANSIMDSSIYMLWIASVILNPCHATHFSRINICSS